MPTLIKNKAVQENDWHFCDSAEQINDFDKIVVPVSLFIENRAQLTDKLGEQKVGLLLESHEGIDDLPEGFETLPLIALNFPAFTDGRAYSTARDILRYTKFTGELRAVGDVLPDQLHAMARCGFTEFDLVDGVDVENAIKLIDVFSAKYQSDALERKPSYQR